MATAPTVLNSRDPFVTFLAVPFWVAFALVLALAGLPIVSLSSLFVALVFWQYAHRSVTITDSEWVFIGALTVFHIRRDAITSVAAGHTGYALRGYGWELGASNLVFPAPGDVRGSYVERGERLEALAMIPGAVDSRQEPVRKARYPSAATTLTFVGLAVGCSLLAMWSATI